MKAAREMFVKDNFFLQGTRPIRPFESILLLEELVQVRELEKFEKLFFLPDHAKLTLVAPDPNSDVAGAARAE